VIANLATKKARIKINPNAHVNMSQSSNDVIPTAICISALLDTQRLLMPALEHLIKTLIRKAYLLGEKSKQAEHT
jgi:fumarate hydratase class II